MNWRNQLHRGRSNLDVTMTPMIDVVFLLLIYFLWTSSFQIAEFDLQSRITAELGSEQVDISEPPPPEADFNDIVVRVRWDGAAPTWQINDAPIASLTDVYSHLDRIAQINPAANVILHPDDLVPLGDVIDVFDAARRAGFNLVSFAASPQ